MIASKTAAVIKCTGAKYLDKDEDLNEKEIIRCWWKTRKEVAGAKSSAHRIGAAVDERYWKSAKDKAAEVGFVVGCDHETHLVWGIEPRSKWDQGMCKAHSLASDVSKVLPGL